MFQRSGPWNYALNQAHNTTYIPGEVRVAVEDIGFERLFEETAPQQQEWIGAVSSRSHYPDLTSPPSGTSF